MGGTAVEQPISAPFAAALDEVTGVVMPEGAAGCRRLSAMAELFLDTASARERAAHDDLVVYSSSAAPVPAAEGHVGFGQTRIEPGDVAGELFMTHGHAHVRRDGEAYIGQRGEGGILLAKDSEVVWVPMAPGVVGYIPPGWRHRSVNTGATPFVFISVYPALSGQDYDVVRREGLGARVLRTADGYRVVTDAGDVVHEGSAEERG